MSFADAIWLKSLIPASYLNLIGPASLILIGFIVETRYTSRVALFSNAMALVAFFHPFNSLPWWLVLYINAATAVGAIAIVSYKRYKLNKEYYRLGKLFSTAITGLILLLYGFSLYSV